MTFWRGHEFAKTTSQTDGKNTSDYLSSRYCLYQRQYYSFPRSDFRLFFRKRDLGNRQMYNGSTKERNGVKIPNLKKEY